jgi:hypothetical protein
MLGKWLMFQKSWNWVEGRIKCGALCNKNKFYYRCTHPPLPHPSYIIVIQR